VRGLHPPILLLLLAASLPGQRLPEKQDPTPRIGYIYPAGGKVGSTFEATVGGQFLSKITGARFTDGGITAEVLSNYKPNKRYQDSKAQDNDQISELARMKIRIDPDAVPGERELRLLSTNRISNRLWFFVSELDEFLEKEPNHSREKATAVDHLPAVLGGQIMPGDQDCFRFSLRKGQKIVIQCPARRIMPFLADAVPGWFQSCLALYDASGKEVAFSGGFRFDPDPLILYSVPESGEYVLEVKDSLFRGREDFVYRITVGELPFVTDLFPLGGRQGAKVELSLQGINLPSPKVDFLPDAEIGRNAWFLPSPRRFPGNRLPYSVDGLPEVYSSRSNLASNAAQFLTQPVIVNGRIERDGEFRWFRFVGTNRERIVLEVKARRLGSSLDAVLALLDERGNLIAENDDAPDPAEGFLTHLADPYLSVTLPRAGTYFVKLSDTEGNGGADHAYRLRLGPPQPDFDLRLMPANLTLPVAGSAAVTVTAIRRDGFSGDIRIEATNLPGGFTMSEALIPGNQATTRFTLTAPTNAEKSLFSPGFFGTARLGSNALTRPALPAEELMQAFAYLHLVPTRELLIAAGEEAPFALGLAWSNDVEVLPLELAFNEETFATVKINRLVEVVNPVRLNFIGSPREIKVRTQPPLVIASNQDSCQVPLSLWSKPQETVRYALILTGTTRVGKENYTVTLPAIPVVCIGVRGAEGKPWRKKAP